MRAATDSSWTNASFMSHQSFYFVTMNQSSNKHTLTKMQLFENLLPPPHTQTQIDVQFMFWLQFEVRIQHKKIRSGSHTGRVCWRLVGDSKWKKVKLRLWPARCAPMLENANILSFGRLDKLYFRSCMLFFCPTPLTSSPPHQSTHMLMI